MVNNINFKANRSLKKQAASLLLLGVVAIVMTVIVSSVYRGASQMINRDPYQVAISKIGDLSMRYPTGMVEEHNTGKYHDTITLRSSYNSSAFNDVGRRGTGVLVFIKVNDTSCQYKGCKTINEQYDFEKTLFEKVYFYKDKQRPNKLEQDRRYSDISLKFEHRVIGGHKADYYEIIRNSKTGMNYEQIRYIIMKDGDILIQIQASIKNGANPENLINTDEFDKMINSLEVK